MPPYRLVIFDFDGTLADSLPWFRSVWGELAEQFGLPKLTPEEMEAMRGLSGREVMHKLRVPAWKLPKMVQHMRAVKLEAAASTPLFDGVHELLAALRVSGVRVAIVSSDSEASVRRVLGEETSGQVWQFDCGAAVFGKAAKFKRMVRLARVAPHEALSVGDEVRDIEAAKKAAIPSAGVSWGYTLPQALAAQCPELMFDTFPQMSAYLLGQEG